MRILKLRFNNIHSFKGAHEIRFDAEPLLSAGLFAILGPTGAGKSTILDALSLSLFNEIPRYGKVSQTKIDLDGSVITHHTSDAYVETEYEVKGQVYMSTWRVHRSGKSAKLQAPTMTLATLPDHSILFTKISEVPVQNEAIIGLSYEQFVRSIVLAQGDFAKFLKADSNDRAKLLEDITGTDIYRKIGKLAFEKYKALNVDLNNLRLETKNIDTLNEEDQKNLETLKINNTLQINELTTHIIEFDKSLQQLLLKKEKTAEKVKLEAELAHCLNDWQAMGDEINLLDKHKKLEPSIISLLNYKQYNEQLKLNKSELEYFRSSKLQAEAHNLVAIESMSKLINDDVSKENFMIKMRDFQSRVNFLMNKLDQLTANGQEASAKYQHQLAKFPDQNIVRQLVDLNRVKQYEILENIAGGFSHSILNFEISDQDLNDRIAKLEDQINLENLVLNSLKQKESISEELQRLNVEIRNTDILVTARTVDIQTLENQQHELNDLIEKIELKIADQAKVATLEVHRHSLVDGQACPLCGALHHPYAVEIPDNDYAKDKSELAKLNSTMLTLLKTIQVKQNEKSVAEGAQTSMLKRINEINIQINEISTNIAIAYQNKTSEELNTSTEFIKVNLKNLKSEYSRRINHNNLTNLLPYLKECIKIGDEYSQIKLQKKQLYNGEKEINSLLDEIQNSFSNTLGQIQGFIGNIKVKSDDIDALEKTIENLSYQLVIDLKHLGYTSIEDAMNNIIAEDKKRIIESKVEKQREKHQEITTKLEVTEDALKKLVEVDITIDQLALKAKIEMLKSQQLALSEENGNISMKLEIDITNKEKLAKIYDLIRTHEAVIKPWEWLSNKIGDATGNAYAKFAQNLTLQHLINLANNRLGQLTDRYTLENTSIESDLRVMDAYQGNITRSIKTLSGGETFILSLALALSLSDLASRNVRLDCLFIDEGFGTLDSDTLDMALSTLERLQSDSNRMIGIISHVESLKERITTQIKVVRSGNGMSIIEVINV